MKPTLYLLGGPPRIGKTTIAAAFSKATQVQYAKTDSIRAALKEAVSKKHNPDLFLIDERVEYLNDTQRMVQFEQEPEHIVEIQNTVSRSYWSSIEAYAHEVLKEGRSLLLEGVAILPEFVKALSVEVVVPLFVGNTNPDHWKYIAASAKANNNDWLHAKPENYIRGFSKFVNTMSEYVKEEASKYKYDYFELDDVQYHESIQKVVSLLTK